MRSYKFCHNRYKSGYTCTAFAFTGYHSVFTSQDKEYFHVDSLRI
jgi:hypothetical protein